MNRVLMAAAVMTGLIHLAQAQGTSTPMFQNATITGSGNAITATRVPVLLSTSLVVYVDVTIQFNADQNGNLSISGSPTFAQSATPITGNFVAGTYLAPNTMFNGKGLIVVSGPAVGDGGTTMWSLTTAPGTDPSIYPVSATWWVGPLANNPYATRLNAASITSTAYSYGIASAQNGDCIAPWCAGVTGNIIGVSQTGNVLTIASFSDDGTLDKNVPYSILTFTKQ
ncbi:MAG TPA: hypothetical protein VMB03_17425 [Bryobacteraceae bacterium]|nr:hypothetical protein [Bryobacteraceae bacterium]